MSYKKFVTDNELDLSLSNLVNVNTTELKSLNKVTSIDLSCNHITELPDDFSDLRHIVKLDVSKNSLKLLPSSFGNLRNLTQLDLRGNCLTSLPPSFCQLSKLRWLDLKDNPDLDPAIAKAAGNCLSQQECSAAATAVVQHMKGVAAQMERQRQARLLEEREVEARRRKIEEEERSVLRERKKADRAARKKEHEDRQARFGATLESNSNIPSKNTLNEVTNNQSSSNFAQSILQFFMMFHLFIFSALIFIGILHLSLHTCYDEVLAVENPLCKTIVSWVPRELHVNYQFAKNTVIKFFRGMTKSVFPLLSKSA